MQYTVHDGRTHRRTENPKQALELAQAAGKDAYVTAESARCPGRERIVWTPGMPAARSLLMIAASRL